jgi:hypothetical protein
MRFRLAQTTQGRPFGDGEMLSVRFDLACCQFSPRSLSRRQSRSRCPKATAFFLNHP